MASQRRISRQKGYQSTHGQALSRQAMGNTGAAGNEAGQLVIERQRWLLHTVLAKAVEAGYTWYTSMPCRTRWKSIARHTRVLAELLSSDHAVVGVTEPDPDTTRDSWSALLVREALLHRSRGTTPTAFVGLLKIYRHGYNAILDRADLPVAIQRWASELICRLFDRAELHVLNEWYEADAISRHATDLPSGQLRNAIQNLHRLASIGALMSEVAHETNNHLTGIMNYAELISDIGSADRSIGEYAREIAVGAERIATITRCLVSFAGSQCSKPEAMGVDELIGPVVTLVSGLARRGNVLISTDLSPTPLLLVCDRQRVRHVLVNLLMNAHGALSAQQGRGTAKRIRICSSAFTRDSQAWLKIAIDLGGDGIPADALDRLLSPFYMPALQPGHPESGSSIGRQIIQEHHGMIGVESDGGHLTYVYIDLPAVPYQARTVRAMRQD